MLETPHAAVGAAIALAIPNPLISLPLAFASHFILDKVPHWNPHIHTELKKHGRLQSKTVFFIVGDSLVAGALGLILAFTASSENPAVFVAVLLGAFAGTLPDLIEMPYYFLKYRSTLMEKYVMWQKGIQEHTDTIYGVVTQVIVFVAAIWWFVQLV